MRQQTIPGFLHGHHRIDKRTNVAHQNFPLFDRKSVKRISDLAQKLLNTAINLAHTPTPTHPSNQLTPPRAASASRCATTGRTVVLSPPPTAFSFSNDRPAAPTKR